MKLSKPIVLQQYPYTDAATNKVVEPMPFMMDSLAISYIINVPQKLIYAQITNIPQMIMLYNNSNFPSDPNSISLASLEESLKSMLGDNPQQFLQNLFPKTLEADPNGPGSILSGLISMLGITVTAGCSCKRHALEMNAKGADWCEANMDTIVGWLREESNKRKLPFIESFAKLLVNRAIKMSRKMKAKEQR